MSDTLQAYLQSLQAKIPVDLFIGRKIPWILEQAGFRNISWKVVVTGIQGEELIAEKEITAERLSFSLPILAKILGSESKANELKSLYLEEMMRPNAVLFYNKFIVSGQK